MPALADTISSLSRQGGESLRGIRRGMEKESLRITPQGRLALSAHPNEFGSPLTHPHITTDFSEALLEFITPPCDSIDQMLAWCDDIHRLVCHALKQHDELLWASSMPCVIGDDKDIPIARYGNSNSAKMKYLYRVGLGYRYGRSMQIISGIHYNVSFPDEFWAHLKRIEKIADDISLRDYKTQKYFSLIRNFRRYFWLLLYLFGAAPAICPTFIKNRSHHLKIFNGKSLYQPFATSLRMGDLGYQSEAQEALVVDYNSLHKYAETLLKGLTTSHPEYEKIGVRVGDEYRQLNSNLLQIENEFYSTIRPKREALRGEAPINALLSRGVEYIEVRSIDVNLFDPLGIESQQAHFLEAFLLFCLLDESPQSSYEEYQQIMTNQYNIVDNGRDPEAKIYCHGEQVPVRDCGKRLLDKIAPVAELLAGQLNDDRYQRSMEPQYQKLEDGALTPSAKILQAMESENLSFYELALRQSSRHFDEFTNAPLPAERQQYFDRVCEDSLAELLKIENNDSQDFDTYLENYFRQYEKCR